MINIDEIAMELAEYECHSMAQHELQEVALAYLQGQWLKRSTEAPEAVLEAYLSLVGNPEEG